MESNKSTLSNAILNSGDRIYRIIKALGTGGFGITYLVSGEVTAGNITTEAQFAIKEHFPSEFAVRENDEVRPKPGKEEQYQRSMQEFIAEANKLQKLGVGNDNIVKVNEVFEANGTAYYVMQYIKGESLTKFVADEGPLSIEDTLSILAPIFDAVDFLHKSRINHLDIKPDNIMLEPKHDGLHPVLIDFGLSVHFKKNGSKTSPKEIQGVSKGYSPLEQYAGIREFNPATDIYSLAATILFCLTGKDPKEATLLKNQDIENSLPKKDLEEEDYIRLRDALKKALNKSFEDRHQSVEELKMELGMSDMPNDNSTQPIIVKGGKDFNFPKKIVVIILACVLLGAFLTLIFRNPGTKEEDDILLSDDQTELPLKDTDSLVVVEFEEEIAEIEETTNNTSANTENIAQQGADLQQSPQSPKQNENKIAENKTDKKEAKDSKTSVTADKHPASSESSSLNNNGSQSPKPAESRQQKTISGTIYFGYASWTGGIWGGKPDGSGVMTFTASHSVDKSSSIMAEPGYTFKATYDKGSLISGKLYDSNGNLVKTIIP